jgi:hypothetical protein
MNDTAEQTPTIAETLIRELTVSISRRSISSYYEFAEKWNKAFLKDDKRSRHIIREVSPKLGIAPTTIYSILSVTKKYPKKSYLALQEKMQRTNNVLLWARIRVMAQCCGGTEKLLEQAEDLLLRNQYTDKEWLSVCRKIADIPAKASRKFPMVTNKTKPIVNQTLPEVIETIRNVASRLHYFSDSVIKGRLELDKAKSFMRELEEAIDVLNTHHSRLMESCEYGDIVKVGELEMQREHYDRYMEVRNKIEKAGRKPIPAIFQ